MAVVEIKFKDLREAVASLNESGLITEKIKLVGLPKEEILKEFLAAVDAIPNNAEGKFPGPKNVLDFYNSVLDAEEKTKNPEQAPPANAPAAPETPVAPEAPAAVQEVKADANAAAEQKTPEEVKAPQAEKDKSIEKAKGTAKISATTRVMMLIVDNQAITNEEIKKKMAEEGINISDSTLVIQRNDTLKTIKYLKEKGMMA